LDWLGGRHLGGAARDRGRDLVGVDGERRDVDHDHRIDGGVGPDRGHRAGQVLGLGRREHVHGVAHAGRGRQERPKLHGGVGGELGKLQPPRLAGVGEEDPRPARVRHDTHPRSLRYRLRCEQRHHVEQVLERVGPDDARLLEERVHRDVQAG